MYVIIDTETTGLDPVKHAMISVGFVFKPDLNKDYIAAQKEFKMNPGTYSIDKRALTVNGYTEEEIKSWPDRAKTIESIKKMIENWGLAYDKMTPVGHNYLFDRGFLLQILPTHFYEVYFSYHYMDTMNVANFFNLVKPGFSKGVSLGALREKYNVPHDGAHSALADALATAEVMKGLINEVELR